MRYNKKYIQKMSEHRLPLLQDDDRIYLNVPYRRRGFAKATNCGYDSEKKLWFTGMHNTSLSMLIEVYGVNEATSEKVINLLKQKDLNVTVR